MVTPSMGLCQRRDTGFQLFSAAGLHILSLDFCSFGSFLSQLYDFLPVLLIIYSPLSFLAELFLATLCLPSFIEAEQFLTLPAGAVPTSVPNSGGNGCLCDQCVAVLKILSLKIRIVILALIFSSGPLGAGRPYTPLLRLIYAKGKGGSGAAPLK